MLVCHFRLKLLGLVDHLLHLTYSRHAATDVILGVDLLQLRLQILCYPVTELLHGVNPGLLQQFRELRTYAIDAEQVGMVCPAEDQFLGDACGLCLPSKKS